jgi:hypothetical protein
MSILDDENTWMEKSRQIAVEAWAEKNIECTIYPGYEDLFDKPHIERPVNVIENSIICFGNRVTITDFIPSSIDTIEGPTTIVKIDETISTYLPKRFVCNSQKCDGSYKSFRLITCPSIQEHNYHGTYEPLVINGINFENFSTIKFSGTNLSKIEGQVIGYYGSQSLQLLFDGTLIEDFADINGLVLAWDIRDIYLDINNTKLAHHLTWEVNDIDEVSNIINSQYAWAYNLTRIRLSQHVILEKQFEYNLDGSKKCKWKLSNDSISYFESLKIKDFPF